MYEQEAGPGLALTPAQVEQYRGMQNMRTVRPEPQRAAEDLPTYSQLIAEEHKLGAYAAELVERLEAAVARMSGRTLNPQKAHGNGGQVEPERELLEMHRRANSQLGHQLEQIRQLIDQLGSRL